MRSEGQSIRRKAAEAACRPGKAPRYLSPEKHTRPVERGRRLARTLLKFLDYRSGPPFPKFFGESFSPEFWVSWTPAGVERGRPRLSTAPTFRPFPPKIFWNQKPSS